MARTMKKGMQFFIPGSRKCKLAVFSAVALVILLAQVSLVQAGIFVDVNVRDDAYHECSAYVAAGVRDHAYSPVPEFSESARCGGYAKGGW